MIQEYSNSHTCEVVGWVARSKTQQHQMFDEFCYHSTNPNQVFFYT